MFIYKKKNKLIKYNKLKFKPPKDYQLILWLKKWSTVWKQPCLKLFSFTANALLGAVFLHDWAFPVSYSHRLQ